MLSNIIPTSSIGNIESVKSLEDLSTRVCEHIISIAKTSISNHDIFHFAISGGNTPGKIFSLLEKKHIDCIDWTKVCFYWTDERWVPHNHPDSNYKLAKDTMPNIFNRSHIHKINTESILPKESSSEYEKTLLETIKNKKNNTPIFDLILLGIGDDGHTASLFPDSIGLDSQGLVTENFIETLSNWRITLTFRSINNANNTLFIVNGLKKNHIVNTILSGDQTYPISYVDFKKTNAHWVITNFKMETSR